MGPDPHLQGLNRGDTAARQKSQYADREETLRAGDMYYMPAGHTGAAEEDTECLEVAPSDLHQQFVGNANRNLAAAQST